MAVNIMGNTHEVFKFKDHGTVDAHVWLMQETLEYVAELTGIQQREVLDIEYDDSNWQYYCFRITLSPQSPEEFEAYLERLRAKR